MREAGVMAFVMRHGLVERLLWVTWAGLCVGVGTAGVAMHAALATDARGVLVWGAGFGAAAGAMAAALAWRSIPDARWRLEARAGCWYLASDDNPAVVREGRVDAMMDLGGWMLLRFREAEAEPRRDAWLTASASRLGAGWHPLRAALFRPDRAAGAVRQV